MPILAKKLLNKSALSLSLTTRLPSAFVRGPILLLLTGFVALTSRFQYAAVDLAEAIFSVNQQPILQYLVVDYH